MEAKEKEKVHTTREVGTRAALASNRMCEPVRMTAGRRVWGWRNLQRARFSFSLSLPLSSLCFSFSLLVQEFECRRSEADVI